MTTDALVLKHKDINIHSADQVIIVLDQFSEKNVIFND